MYYEFYIDIFLVENMLMDFALLLLTGQILHWKVSFRRLLLGSLCGAFGACILVLLPVRNLLVVFLIGYVMLSILMIKIGFAVNQRRELCRGVVCLYGLTFLIGGIFQALFSRITLPVVILGILSVLLLVLLLGIYQSIKYKAQSLYSVTLSMQDKTQTVTGLKDTGNHLKEPIFGRPVSVADYEIMKDLINQETKLFYIPYHSIGKSNGLLLGVTLDYMSIQRDQQQQRIEHPVIAISKEPVSSKGEYRILLNPIIMDE